MQGCEVSRGVVANNFSKEGHFCIICCNLSKPTPLVVWVQKKMTAGILGKLGSAYGVTAFDGWLGGQVLI